MPGVNAAGTAGDKFFDHTRFTIDNAGIDKIPETKKAREDIRLFAEYFDRGKRYLSEGDLHNASINLFSARKIWPEYYGTDFVIARMYEGSSDPGLSARFYKSYLGKLRNFYDEKFRMSSAIVRFISGNKVEKYGYAEDMVRRRLAEYGIDLDRVRPAVFIPDFFTYLMFLIFFSILYLLIAAWIFPIFRKRNRIKNVPEGFWICKYCLAMSPELSNSCVECRRLRQ